MKSKITFVARQGHTIDRNLLSDLNGQITDARFSPDNRALTIASPQQPTRDMRDDFINKHNDIDVFVYDADLPPPKLLMADMDSTIITGETLDELAAHFDLRDEIATITDKAMRGEIDFKAALKARVAMLQGLEESALDKVIQGLTLSAGATELLRGCKARGITCILVSGGFTHVTGYIAEKMGFDAHYGNTLLVKNGRLTGKVKMPIQDKSTKLEQLAAWAEKLKIPLAETMAVGDGANDLPMLKAAGYGIAYKAKPIVASETHLQLNHTDLSALLYLMPPK